MTMTNRSLHSEELRRRAEVTVVKETAAAYEALPPEQRQQMLHKLLVQQIELEMQNEELRHAQQQLERQSERYFDLYDVAPVGYLTLNELGDILEANLTAASMLTTTKTDLLAKSITDFILPEDQDLFYLLRKKVSETNRTEFLELRLMRAGSSFWADLQVVMTDDGEYWITVIDITPRKRNEAEGLIHESQFQHAQMMESIGRLAGGVAHDFNNMLTVILGHAELARMRIDQSSAVYDDLVAISNAAESSVGLTRQLLTFARKQVIDPKRLDLNETISGMLKMLQRLIGEDIRLNWHPSPDLWSVKLDPSQVDQILANLCVNASDSIADVGRITIETENCITDEEYSSVNMDCVPGEYVRLTISDDGCGMDRETQAQIFEPFFTTKGIGEGTGLGLAMIYGIVKQNRGFINVYSEPGVGTSFSIYLPRHTASTGLSPAAEAAKPARGGHETILLAEDDPAILNLTAKLLSKLGYRVLAANSPAEARRLASEHSSAISLLLTDVVMPEMNGRDLAKSIQALNSQIKCMYMSGYTSDVIATHGLLATGVHFIQKPFSMNLLAAKLREVLDQ